MNSNKKGKKLMGFLKIGSKSHPIYEGLNTIGRNPKAVVNIKNINISQNHSMITVVDEKQHFISDLGSSNGSYLKNSKLEPLKLYPLESGDAVSLADVKAVYEKVFVGHSEPVDIIDATQNYTQTFYGNSTQIIKNVDERLDELSNLSTQVRNDLLTEMSSQDFGTCGSQITQITQKINITSIVPKSSKSINDKDVESNLPTESCNFNERQRTNTSSPLKSSVTDDLETEKLPTDISSQVSCDRENYDCSPIFSNFNNINVSSTSNIAKLSAPKLDNQVQDKSVKNNSELSIVENVNKTAYSENSMSIIEETVYNDDGDDNNSESSCDLMGPNVVETTKEVDLGAFTSTKIIDKSKRFSKYYLSDSDDDCVDVLNNGNENENNVQIKKPEMEQKIAQDSDTDAEKSDSEDDIDIIINKKKPKPILSSQDTQDCTEPQDHIVVNESGDIRDQEIAERKNCYKLPEVEPDRNDVEYTVNISQDDNDIIPCTQELSIFKKPFEKDPSNINQKIGESEAFNEDDYLKPTQSLLDENCPQNSQRMDANKIVDEIYFQATQQINDADNGKILQLQTLPTSPVRDQVEETVVKDPTEKSTVRELSPEPSTYSALEKLKRNDKDVFKSLKSKCEVSSTTPSKEDEDEVERELAMMFASQKVKFNENELVNLLESQNIEVKLQKDKKEKKRNTRLDFDEAEEKLNQDSSKNENLHKPIGEIETINKEIKNKVENVIKNGSSKEISENTFKLKEKTQQKPNIAESSKIDEDFELPDNKRKSKKESLGKSSKNDFEKKVSVSSRRLRSNDSLNDTVGDGITEKRGTMSRVLETKKELEEKNIDSKLNLKSLKVIVSNCNENNETVNDTKNEHDESSNNSVKTRTTRKSNQTTTKIKLSVPQKRRNNTLEEIPYKRPTKTIDTTVRSTSRILRNKKSEDGRTTETKQMETNETSLSTLSNTVSKVRRLSANSRSLLNQHKAENNVQKEKLSLNSTPRKRKADTTTPKTPEKTFRLDADFVLDTPSEGVKRKQKPKIVFTMLDDPEIEATIRRLGGTVVDTVDECTVLVTENVKRTHKLLAAVGQGKPICSPKWVMACKKANTFLDPWDFIIIDKEAEKKWSFSLKESLLRSKRKKLFEGYTFQLIVNTAVDVLKGAIESCGAKCVTRNLKKYANDNLVIVSTTDSKTKYEKIIQQDINVKVVEPEAIFDGTLRQEIRFDRYLLAEK